MQIDYPDLQPVEALFNRYYEFKPLDPHFALPQNPLAYFSGEVFEVPELQALKTKLNYTKNKLNDIDITHWSKHTDFTSRSRDIVFQLRERIQPGIKKKKNGECSIFVTICNLIF